VDPGHSSNVKQSSQEVDTLRAELSSLIAINLTLSNELTAARENRSRIRTEMEGSRVLFNEKGNRMDSLRNESPMNFGRIAHFGTFDVDLRSSNIRKERSTDEKLFDRELRKLKQDMSAVKVQNERINRRNLELTHMNEYLMSSSTSVMLVKKDFDSGLIRV
jgi:hypothetical protein